MTKIVGIAGKKQSGKNTTANIIHGIVMKEKGLILDFNIGANGQLMVLTTNAKGEEGWGELDVTRKDPDFVNYAEKNLWPYIKMYSFADPLKWMCVELFDIPKEQLFGTNKQKNTKCDHLTWDNMPVHPGDINTFKPSSKTSNKMTAREFMQYFGTNIMRRIYNDIWTSHAIKKINKEQTEMAIICDVRFPNEVESILEQNGSVIKLQRSPYKDNHPSEVALDKKNFDQSKFTHLINNRGKSTIDTLISKVKDLYKQELCIT